VEVDDCVKRLFFEGVEGKVLTARPSPSGTKTWIRLEGDIPGHEVAIEPDSARFWVYLSRADGGSTTTD